MRLEYLKYLITIKETHSLTKTAELHYISPPALFKSLKSIEKEYGCSLYFTKSKNVYLTTEGEILAQFAINVFEENEKAQKKLNELATRSYSNGIPFQILSFTAFTNYLFNNILDFAEENKIPILPGITSISAHNIESCIEAILHAKENIILLSINKNILSTLLEKLSDTIVYYDILLEDQIVLCMSDNTILGRETVFTGNELAMKYLSYSVFSYIPNYNDFTYPPFITVSSDTALLKSMLHRKNCAALMPGYLAKHAFNNKKYILFDMPSEIASSVLHIILFKDDFPNKKELCNFLKYHL